MPIQKFFLQDATSGRTSRICSGIEEVAQTVQYSRIRAAVAYATLSGCNELVDTIGNTGAWMGAEKQWLISIDYGITEPEALRFLAKLPSSIVRVPNGTELLKSKLKPRQAFHTKAYIFDNEKKQCLGIFTGSANLTFSGLRLNAENGTSIIWSPKSDKQSLALVQNELGWWSENWDNATPMDSPFLKEYSKIWRPQAPTEDETELVRIFTNAGETEVNTQYGLAWATSKYFWMETYELYKNRGPDNPGNQLDCVRGTRTYFGFSPERVDRNTVIGEVLLQYENKPPQPRSVRFANNSMDKVNLPIPGNGGPLSYDNTFVLFERIGNQHFKIKLANAGDHTRWVKKSKEQGLLYELHGGREYGFFS